MAIFASTTTSGYSDPLKAYSIKALEKRYADMMAQQARQDAPTIANPVQGFGYLANTLADTMAANRAERAVAAGREELAQAMKGYNPETGLTPELAAIAARRDPDLLAKLMETMEARRTQQAQFAQQDKSQQAQFGQQDKSQQAGFAHQDQYQQAQFGQQDKTAATLAETNRKAAEAEAGVKQSAASDLAAKETAQQEARARDAMIMQQQKAEDDLKRERVAAEEKAKLDATDPKKVEARGASETNYRKALSHVQGLDKAIKILTDNPEGEAIYTGVMQGVAPGASGIPGVNMFVDKAKAARTAEYNAIVGGDAIKEMSSTLTGATTNFELQKFEQMRNNPNFTDKQRAEQLQRVKEAAVADAQTLRATSEQMGGKPARVDAAMVPQATPVPGSNVSGAPTRPAGMDDAALIAEAKAAIAAGKNPDLVRKRLEAMGVKGGL